MSSPTQFRGTVSFGEFELDVETAELRNNGSKTVLPGQPFQILITLLGRPGQLITREELKKQLWPSDTFVDFDVSLNKAVNRLREALGDSAEHPCFIETLPRKGYRFIGTIENEVCVSNGDEGVPKETGVSPPLAQKDTNQVAQRSGGTYWLIPAVVLVVLVMIAVLMHRLTHSAPDLTDVRITKVTDSGAATGVAISPDAHFIVYSLRHGGGESLHLRQISTHSDVEILPSGPEFHGLTFSPNGTFVFFVRSDPNDPYFKYLYSVPVLGGPVRKLIADVDSPVSFSPSGEQFAFERAAFRRNVIELRVANADGSDEHVLATIQNGDAGLFQPGPSWSRDGRAIVCPFRILGKEIRWILASVSVPGGTVREIYSDTTPFGRPVWLNGRSLIIPRYDAAYERWQLWTISYPEGSARRFTNDLTDYDEPLDISSDGKNVAAMASTVLSNIWEVPAENSSLAKPVTSGQLPMINVAETTDGRLLSSGGDGRVWTVKADGQREALSNLHNVGWLRKCGDSVLFTSVERNAVTLSRATVDGSRSLTLFSGDLAYPGCSPDGKFAYYVNRHRPQKVWRLSMQGGSPEEITDGMGEGVTGWLDISPDGKLLSYTFDQYNPAGWKLAVIPARGGSALRTFDVPGGTTRVRWSPNGSGLQYLLTQDGATNVWEQALEGGKPKQLTKFTSGRIFDFSWSSDNRRLFLTRGDVTSDVVLLNNLR
jgi:DNA-binding winged helix-turn-helix (wHTH) protein/dipeptidyl aminopeptidase/acylaminoacyl peptidase